MHLSKKTKQEKEQGHKAQGCVSFCNFEHGLVDWASGQVACFGEVASEWKSDI